MSQIALSPPAGGTGVFTIAAPATNTNRTLTLPDETGTVLSTATPGVPVNGPAFSAFQGTSTTLPNATATKVLISSEFFDTNLNFDNSRFTPTVAGYYQISANVTITTVGASTNLVYLYKNGSEFLRGGRVPTSSATVAGMTVAAVVFLNGSTDYLEIYAFTNGGAGSTDSGTATHFSGALVRSAL